MPQLPVRAGSSLSAGRRAADLAELAAAPDRWFDLAVIGGGVTGAGVALDAATRGLKVVLLERADLASGTSSFSSKLAHGGLRYLASGHVGIAWESAQERHALITYVAPHLINPLPMVTPVGPQVQGREAALVRLGYLAGDVLRRAAGTSAQTLPRPRRISAARARDLVPALSPEGLTAGLVNWDGQLIDDARYVIALARTAAAHGATILTYTAVTGVDRGSLAVTDRFTGATTTIRARHIVNATGVWADRLDPGITLRPSRGSHLLVAASRLGNPRAALTVPVPGHFGRFVFAVPWPDGLVMIGLTDEPQDGPVPEVPTPTDAELDFLLDTVNRALATPLTRADIVGRFAGLRPLLASGSADSASADLSRRHTLRRDERTGMISVVGGKFTTYRQMAQDAVDAVCHDTSIAAGPCVTRTLPLVGAGPVDDGLPSSLVRSYGQEAAAVLELGASAPQLSQPIDERFALTGAQIRFAVAHEGAMTVSDVVDRRTRLGLVSGYRDAVEAAVSRLAPELIRPERSPS